MAKSKGRIILYYDEQGQIQIKATGKLKKELEEELAAKAERDKQARIDARNAELQAGEVRYRKSPTGKPISENTLPEESDAEKDLPIEHGTVPVDSELLQGHSPRHTDTNM